MYPKERTDDIPANTIRRTNVDMMLVHSLRCWPNIISRLIQLLEIQLWSSKHKTFVYHLHNVGPTSSTLAQHCINVMQMFCVYLDVSILPAQSVGLASARRYHNPRPIVCYSPDGSSSRRDSHISHRPLSQATPTRDTEAMPAQRRANVCDNVPAFNQRVLKLLSDHVSRSVSFTVCSHHFLFWHHIPLSPREHA